MKREDLILSVRKGIEFEESLIPTLEEFFSKKFEWEGIPEKEGDELRKIIYELISDSDDHKKELYRLMSKINGSDKREF